MAFLPDTNVWISLLNPLELQGRVIGPNDLKIAAIARAHG